MGVSQHAGRVGRIKSFRMRIASYYRKCHVIGEDAEETADFRAQVLSR
jgi:hypothetical protein